MILKIENLEMQFGDRVLFSNVNLQVKSGEKIILIGPNGSGKTTFLKVLSGELEQTDGRIEFYGHKIGSINQFRMNEDKTLYEEGLSAFEEAISFYNLAIDSAMKKNIDEYDNALASAEAYDIYASEKRVREMLKGVGFEEKDFERRLSTLSAGEITKLEIAKMLIMDPELIILDEPGNYLDIYGLEFLNEALVSLKGAVIIATHDRKMMERVPDRIWEIDFGTIKSYDGKYSDFLIQKENFLRSIEHRTDDLDKKIVNLKKSIDRYRQWGRDKSIKQAKSKEKIVAKLEKERANYEFERQKIFKALHFQVGNVTEDVILKVTDLEVFAGQKRIGNFSFEIHNGEKISLLGKNGIGKTSLLKAIISDKIHTSFGPNTFMAYVDTVGSERSKNSVIEEIWKIVPLWKDYEVRRYTGRFGFEGEDVFKSINSLSGGEFVRYQLARALIKNPNFLIMDEPTNHLDLYMIESLEETISEYAGAVLFTTHDLEFAEHIADRFIVMDENGLHHFKDYQKAEDFLKSSVTLKKKASNAGSDVDKRKKVRNRLKKIELEVAEFERQLSDVNDSVKEVELRMMNETDHVKLMKMVQDRDEFEKQAEEIIGKIYDLESEKTQLEEEML
jgi:ATP-binding cassette subfamily F protein 3